MSAWKQSAPRVAGVKCLWSAHGDWSTVTARGVGDPIGLRMPAGTAAAAVATCAPPRDAHAEIMLIAEDCPNVPLSPHCFICLCLLFEMQRFIWLLVEPQSVTWRMLRSAPVRASSGPGWGKIKKGNEWGRETTDCWKLHNWILCELVALLFLFFFWWFR